jgi:ActR/RegA family two-component response regulator
MTRAATVASVIADVRAHAPPRLTVSLRGEPGDLFGQLDAVRELGAAVGQRLLVSTGHETVAADVVSVEAGTLELVLLASLDAPSAVTLRRAFVGRGGR